MSKYSPFTGTTVTLLTSEQQPPPYVCWMSNPYRGAMLAEYPVAFEAVERVAFANANWDGYGALPVSAEAKKNALEAIKVILPVAPTPEINPNPSGTLSFEWGTQLGNAHLEIGKTRYSFYVNPSVGEPIFLEGEVETVHRLHGSLVASLLYPSSSIAGTMIPVRRNADVRYSD